MITTRRNILNYYIKPYINILLFGSTLIFFVFNIVTKGLEFNSFQDFKILFYFFVLVFLCYYSILSNKQNIMSHFVFLNWLRLLSIERIDELFIRQQKILIT
jgi:DMSO/TMAO reductase YedYZ heme-binding membrane subunit